MLSRQDGFPAFQGLCLNGRFLFFDHLYRLWLSLNGLLFDVFRFVHNVGIGQKLDFVQPLDKQCLVVLPLFEGFRLFAEDGHQFVVEFLQYILRYQFGIEIGDPLDRFLQFWGDQTLAYLGSFHHFGYQPVEFFFRQVDFPVVEIDAQKLESMAYRGNHCPCVQREPQLDRDQLYGLCHRLFGLVFGMAQDYKIIGISHKTIVFVNHQFVKCIKIEIGQKRGNYSSLRDSFRTLFPMHVFIDAPHFDEHADQFGGPRAFQEGRKLPEQGNMRDCVEKIVDVARCQPGMLLVGDKVAHLVDGFYRSFMCAIGIADIEETLFEARLHGGCNGSLDNFVADGKQAEPAFLEIAFRDKQLAVGQLDIIARLELSQQLLEVKVDVARVVFHGKEVDASGRVFFLYAEPCGIKRLVVAN